MESAKRIETAEVIFIEADEQVFRVIHTIGRAAKLITKTECFDTAIRDARDIATANSDWIGIMDGGRLEVKGGAILIGSTAVSHIRQVVERRKWRSKVTSN